jgi:hypothetical protein
MSIQPALFDAVPGAVSPASAPALPLDAKARGAVFTKPAVVDFMLDLLGYTPDRPLAQLRLLEPSFGSGSFLLRAADRLLTAWRRDGDEDDTVLDPAVRAVELDEVTFAAARREVVALLLRHGVPELSAGRIARRWLVQGDFLTTPLDGGFDVIVGNPPYVRQELLSEGQLAFYRSAFPTMVGRADLYVAFFERSLGLLAPGGRLSFICADAWTKNDYGRELRRLVTSQFSLRAYVDMYGLDSFEAAVGAYPSVTVIAREPAAPVRVARATSASAEDLTNLAAGLTGSGPSPLVRTIRAPDQGSAPWLVTARPGLDVIRYLEARFTTLEEVGCRVGIGVATGADKVFLGPYADLDVEDSRKLPLAVNKDIVGGQLTWHGMGVVNPWADGGGLVDLGEFPRLARYLGAHRDRLARRHTARSDPERRWYKTIDRITPALTWQPKLLIPDIRGDGDAISYDRGTVYPHHNLYYIVSQRWDLRALQALLRSGVAHLFVDAYAVRIGGGYLRFQAQYLRRIRIPAWDSLSPSDQDLLTRAGQAGEKIPTADVERLYSLPGGSLDCLEERP